MKEIRFVDTTLRDGHQSLWATRMKTAHMLPVAEIIDGVGYKAVELMGTVHFDACLRYLREDPWELKNLAEDEAYASVRHELLARLYRHLDQTEDPILHGAITPPLHLKSLELLKNAAT